jgi:hypothetical protein
MLLFPVVLTVATLILFRALKLTIACAKLLMKREGWGVGARVTKHRMMMMYQPDDPLLPLRDLE